MPLEVCPLSLKVCELGVMVTFDSSCHPEPAAESLHPVMFFKIRLESSSPCLQGLLGKDKQRQEAILA